MSVEVAIVGAGAAGIAAARRLAALGRRAVVIEGARRVGGRAVTDHAACGRPIDLGAHWLHSPAENALAPHAARLGADVAPSAMPTRRWRPDGGGGKWLGPDDARAVGEAIERGFRAVAAEPADRAASEVATGLDASAQAAFAAAFAGKQGVALDAGSTRDFAAYVWRGDDLAVRSGYGALLARLAEGLDIRLGVAVTAVDRSRPDRIRIETAEGAVEAAAAIVTVSTGVLAAEAIRFTPAPPDAVRAALDGLPMGACEKIALGFRGDPFGVGAEPETFVAPELGADAPVELVLHGGSDPVAVIMVHDALARGLAAEPEAARAAYALEVLARLFGSSVRAASDGRRLCTRWTRDPLVRGYVSAARPGRADARAALAQPFGPRLFYAGEATHARYAGDVHGAWEAGAAAAEAAHAALGA